MSIQYSAINEKIREVIRAWSNTDDLLKFALTRHGYGDSNGGFGITYPGDLDEYQVEVEKELIPAGMIQVYGFWGPPDGYEFLVPEENYLQVLAEVMFETGANENAQRIKELFEKRT